MTVMSTHRSLNKLEFKAHMSIHNFVEVPEEERHESKAFTRDRWGRKHLLTDAHGDSRLGNLRKKAIVLAGLFLFLGFTGLCAAATSESDLVKKKGPNAQVSSDDPEVHSVDSWMNKDDNKPVLYQNGSTAVGFNSDGDPSVSNRF